MLERFQKPPFLSVHIDLERFQKPPFLSVHIDLERFKEPPFFGYPLLITFSETSVFVAFLSQRTPSSNQKKSKRFHTLPFSKLFLNI